METMKKIFEQLDYFGTSIKLNFNRETKFKTSLGGLITLAIMGLSIALLASLSRNLIVRQQPRSNLVEKYLPSAPLVKPKEENMILSFMLLDRTFALLNDPSIVTLSASQFLSTKTPDGKSSIKLIKLDLKNCSEFKDNFTQMGFANDYELNNLENSVCLNYYNNQTIGGMFATEFFSNIRISAVRCQNSSSSPIICKTKEQINEKISKAYFEFYYINSYIDVVNSTYPFQNFFANWFITADSPTQKIIDFFFQIAEVTSDFGFLFQSYETQSNLIYETTREWNYFVVSDELIRLNINISNMVQHYTRYYMKIQDLSASLGGCINICLIIGMFVTRLINPYKMDQIILNTLFNLNENVENEKFSEKLFDEIEKSRSYIADLRKSTLNFRKFSSKNDSHSAINQNLSNYNEKNSSIQEEIPSPISKLPLNNYFNDESKKNDQKEIEPNQILNLENKKKSEAIYKQLIEYKEKISNKFSMGYYEIICVIFCRGICTKNYEKKLHIYELGRKEMAKYMDYLDIIKLLQEFRKLKLVLLDPDQMTLFNYMSKPLVTNSAITKTATQLNYEKEIEEKDCFDKLFVSYCFAKNNDNNGVNQRLVEFFDSNIKQIFDKIEKEIN